MGSLGGLCSRPVTDGAAVDGPAPVIRNPFCASITVQQKGCSADSGHSSLYFFKGSPSLGLLLTCKRLRWARRSPKAFFCSLELRFSKDLRCLLQIQQIHGTAKGYL